MFLSLNFHGYDSFTKPFDHAIFFFYSSATPRPPEELTVKQLSNRNQELKVSWAEKRDWRYINIEYTVLYHTWGDKHNKVCFFDTHVDCKTFKELGLIVSYLLFVCGHGDYIFLHNSWYHNLAILCYILHACLSAHPARGYPM